MGYLTKFGGFWGMLPQTSGRIFWVAPSASYVVEGRTYSASDNNDGLSPERALLTVDYAVGLTTASVGDVIVLLPGAHSVSATIAVDVAGLIITGIPSGSPHPRARTNSGGQRAYASITTTETTGIIFTVTAADTEIAYLHMIPVAGGSCVSASNAADRLYVHDCTFAATTAANTATFCITFPLGTGTTTLNDQSTIRNCYFYAEDNQGPFVRAAGSVAGLHIESCTFELGGNTAMDDGIEVTLSGSTGVVVRECDFLQRVSGTVFTDCIDVTGVTTDGSTTVYRCYFPVGSDALEASAAADNQCAENYLAQAAASVGGTLVLST